MLQLLKEKCHLMMIHHISPSTQVTTKEQIFFLHLIGHTVLNKWQMISLSTQGISDDITLTQRMSIHQSFSINKGHPATFMSVFILPEAHHIF